MLIALLVLCALVFLVHAWRASLIVLGLVAVLFAWGSTLPPAPSQASYVRR
jgi:hypothetical protein